jgi:imidazoleglycerol phosphate dehydratase HisB
VDVSIGLDGTGQCIAETPVPFLNHMLDVSTSSSTGISPHT